MALLKVVLILRKSFRNPFLGKHYTGSHEFMFLKNPSSIGIPSKYRDQGLKALQPCKAALCSLGGELEAGVPPGSCATVILCACVAQQLGTPGAPPGFQSLPTTTTSAAGGQEELPREHSHLQLAEVCVLCGLRTLAVRVWRPGEHHVVHTGSPFSCLMFCTQGWGHLWCLHTNSLQRWGPKVHVRLPKTEVTLVS